ncbi:MAG TPA: nuclear transport factor 2 family protein [Gammaproteobacteria bacterium]|nr:nuclear transport factor 2 family protein [Gammaproteobacteria bacterium]
MKTLINLLCLISTITLSTLASAANHEEITAPVKSYFKALNESDHKTILQLYSAEPVFMQQGAPAFVGRKAVDKAYTSIFNLLNLNISYDIMEVQTLSPSVALVRTHSAGTAYFKPEKTSRNEASNELFILRLENNAWKIDRYIFSSDHR